MFSQNKFFNIGPSLKRQTILVDEVNERAFDAGVLSSNPVPTKSYRTVLPTFRHRSFVFLMLVMIQYYYSFV